MRSRWLWGAVGLALLWWGSRAAVASLARDPRFLARPAGLRARGPAWGGREVVTPVVERLEALGPINLFDPRFDERIRGALDEVPGVDAVLAIRRHWPDRYSVSCTLHRPVAVVRDRGRLVPVTGDGIVLPVEPYRQAVRALLYVQGVGSAAPAPGERWRSPRLADALAAVLQVRDALDRLAALGIHTVDVSESDDTRKGVVLHGADGIVVRWGRPRAAVGENSVDCKLSYLEIAAENVDQVRGFEIDIRWGRLFLREPAPS